MESKGEIVIKIEASENKDPSNIQKSAVSNSNSFLQSLNQASTEKTVINILEKIGIVGSGHPIICLFHLFFKALSVCLYLFGGLIVNSSSLFLVISMFLVLDFWIVKNLSGRFN